MMISRSAYPDAHGAHPKKVQDAQVPAFLFLVPVYAVCMYSGSSSPTIKNISRRRSANVPLKKMSTADHIEFWGVKVYHAAVFIVIPILAVGWLKLAGRFS
jgi:hypothetical protein